MIRIFNQYFALRTVGLSLVDGSVLAIALFAATWAYAGGRGVAFDSFTAMPAFAFQLIAVAVCFQLCGYFIGRESAGPGSTALDHVYRLGRTTLAATVLLAVLYFAIPGLRIGRTVLASALVLSVVLLWLLRVALDAASVTAMPAVRVVVLGTDEAAVAVARRIRHRHDLNMRVEAFLSNGALDDRSVAAHQVLGNYSDIEDICENFRVGRIVVVHPDEADRLPIRSLVRLRTRGLRIEDANSTLAALTGRIPLHTVGSGWFLFSEGFRRGWVTSVLKRGSDVVLATVGLAGSIPVILAVAAAIVVDDGFPFLYRQRRVGRNGRRFDLLKFRTMRRDAEKNGARWASEGDSRVTRIGRFLRKYRFDEIPQYLNVIRGEMSFVGPRPERPEFVDVLRRQIAFFDERHSVRPGITGWAQVCHPYAASVEDARLKLEYDLFYLKNSSILFDLMIVARTLKTVVFGSGR